MNAPALATTLHAYDRYRLHHVDASEADMIAAVHAGSPLEPDVVWALTQRKGAPDPEDAFKTAPDQWGIFVVKGTTVITYLRLGRIQRSILTGERLPVENSAPPKSKATGMDLVFLFAKKRHINQEVVQVARMAAGQYRENKQLRRENKQLRDRLKRIQKALDFPEGFEL